LWFLPHNELLLQKDYYCRNLARIAKNTLGLRFKTFPIQSFNKIPEFLAMADVVVIPQRKSLATIGQIPAKVFDAMAMAKPIIATNVSDLPEILAGCGLIVKPGRPDKIAEKIQYLIENKEIARKMGGKAREKCIKEYSWDTMERILLKVFKKYEI